MSVNKGGVELAVDRHMPRFLRPFWEQLRASNIGYRLAHGAFWSTMGAGISQSLMLLISVIAARILGREEFGQYGIVISTVGMFSIFAGFGLGTTATKFVAQFRGADPERAGRIIAMSSLVAMGTGVAATIVLVAIAPLLAANTLAAPQLSGILRLASGIILFGAINSSQVGALAGFEAFRSIARINLFSGIFAFICVSLGIASWGLQGALVGQVTALAFTCLVSTFALRKETDRFGIRPRYTNCWAERGLLFRFSLPAVLSGLMVSPVNWLCAAMLVNQANGYAEMGIFNAANSWQKAILFFPGCIGAIALPMLSDFHGAQKRDKYKQALKYNILLNSAAAFTAFLFISVFAKLIMRSYGTQFEDGYSVLIVLCLSSVMIAVGGVIGNAIASAGRMWYGFVFNAMWGIAYISISYFLIPRFGALGLALSNACAYLLHSCWQLVYLKKI